MLNDAASLLFIPVSDRKGDSQLMDEVTSAQVSGILKSQSTFYARTHVIGGGASTEEGCLFRRTQNKNINSKSRPSSPDK